MPIALAAALGAGGCRAAGPTSDAPPDGRPPAGTVVFADEFSGPSIDRSRWTVYTGTVYNNELQAYVDDAANVRIAPGSTIAGAGNGVLIIRATARDAGVGPEFQSARLHGRVLFRYGTAAARIKLPAGAGLWPAFWLLGAGDWPHHGEIDIMENVGDPAWYSVALHGPGYSGNTPLQSRRQLPPARGATDWHVYEVTWTADTIVFRVDGAPVYRVRRQEIAAHGPAAPMDSAKYVVLNLAIGGDYPAAVNGVRSPRHGLPESTVEAIRRGEAVMYVDWVRVTR